MGTIAVNNDLDLNKVSVIRFNKYYNKRYIKRQKRAHLSLSLKLFARITRIKSKKSFTLRQHGVHKNPILSLYVRSFFRNASLYKSDIRFLKKIKLKKRRAKYRPILSNLEQCYAEASLVYVYPNIYP